MELWITAPPIEGAANRAVIEAVAKQLEVPKSMVRIRAGSHGRVKVVEVG
jgi:uncharacterized protein YggU (UPF0235/DUF167 family)